MTGDRGHLSGINSVAHTDFLPVDGLGGCDGLPRLTMGSGWIEHHRILNEARGTDSGPSLAGTDVSDHGIGNLPKTLDDFGVFSSDIDRFSDIFVEIVEAPAGSYISGLFTKTHTDGLRFESKFPGAGANRHQLGSLVVVPGFMGTFFGFSFEQG